MSLFRTAIAFYPLDESPAARNNIEALAAIGIDITDGDDYDLFIRLARVVREQYEDAPRLVVICEALKVGLRLGRAMEKLDQKGPDRGTEEAAVPGDRPQS
jgi:hypothetical protein